MLCQWGRMTAFKAKGVHLASADIKIVELNICVGVTVFRLHFLRWCSVESHLIPHPHPPMSPSLFDMSGGLHILFRSNYDYKFLARTSVPQFSVHQPSTGPVERAFKWTRKLLILYLGVFSFCWKTFTSYFDPFVYETWIVVKHWLQLLERYLKSRIIGMWF